MKRQAVFERKNRKRNVCVDSHCHLDALDYENLHTDIADVVDKAKQRDVKHLLAVGVTLKRFEQTCC